MRKQTACVSGPSNGASLNRTLNYSPAHAASKVLILGYTVLYTVLNIDQYTI